MGKIIRLTESQLKSVIKKVIKEQQNDLELRSAAQQISSKIGEEVSTDEIEDAINYGANPELDLSQVPQNLKQEAQTTFQQLKSKLQNASLGELIKARRDFKKLMKQGAQQTNEQPQDDLGRVGRAVTATAVGGFVGLVAGLPISVTLANILFLPFMLFVLFKLITGIIGDSRHLKTGKSTSNVSNAGMRKMTTRYWRANPNYMKGFGRKPR